MRKHLAVVAAAAFAVGAIGISSQAWSQATADPAAQKEGPAEKTGKAVDNAGRKTGDAISGAAEKTGDALTPGKAADAGMKDPSPSAEEIHDVLAQVAEASATKGGLDDLVERFVDADRNRIGAGEELKKDHADLDGRIAQLQKDWKAKYNQDFDINDEDAVYNLSFARISEGEQGGARTAGARVDADLNTDANTAKAKVDVDNKTGVDAPKANTDGQTAADTNKNDPGRNIATVHIAASHGLPAVDVPMIHEAGGWKIDVADSIDAMKLKDNVQAALTDVDEMKDKWPGDANDAYRHVTHRLLLGILDKPATGGAGAAGGLDTGAAPATPATP